MDTLVSALGSTSGYKTIVTVLIIAMCIYAMVVLFKINIFKVLRGVVSKSGKIVGKSINKREHKYNRDLEIGKLNESKNRSKIYRFLNNLTIDLGLKAKGVTPYEMLYLIIFMSLIMAVVFGIALFGQALYVVLTFPIAFVTLLCAAYTKGNIAHDMRIEAVIEAENMICNSMAVGFEQALEEQYESIPEVLKGDFDKFREDRSLNTHIVKALLNLGDRLGSISDDFIRQVISFEMNEQKGSVGRFSYIVEINNIKTIKRTKIKRKFEKVKLEFIICSLIVFGFMVGQIAIYDICRWFYLEFGLGKIILLLDMLIMVKEFVTLTYLRAQEL